MADTEKKISELTSAAQVNDTDLTVLSQGSAGSGFSSVKATLLAIAQKIVTGINFTSNLHTTDKTVTGAINEVAADGNIAEPYDDTSTYEVGDYCIYQTTLYKCITAVSTAGAWDSTKWDAVLVTDEMGSSGSGGHTILNDSGTSLAQEDDLQFKGVYSHDDSTNEKTIVEVVREFQTESAITSLTGEEAKGFQAIINGNSYEPFKATDIGFNKTGTSYTSDDVDGVLREVNSSVNALNKIWHIGQMVSGTPLTIQCNNFHAILLFGLFQEAGSKFLIVSRSSDTVAVKDVVSGSDFSNAKYTFSVSGSNVVITTTSSAQTTLMWARTEGLL